VLGVGAVCRESGGMASQAGNDLGAGSRARSEFGEGRSVVEGFVG
jgi:hypothetical protein